MEASAVKVLLIDDEPDLLEVSKQFLELDHSISVDTTTSANDALRQIDRQEYDVIVADYQMPGKDGIQLLKEIRGTGNKVPFILFTGKGREEVAIQALNNGADFYLQKGGQSAPQFAELANMIKQANIREKGELALRISEERYRSLFENSVDAVMLTTYDFDSVLSANPSACRMFGMTEAEIRKSGIKGLTLKDEAWEEVLRRLNQTGLAKAEFTYRRKDGTAFTGETTSGVLTGHYGIARIAMIVRDVTERELADETIHESEERFRTYIDNAPEGIFIVDAMGNYLDVNRTACSMLKYSREELLKLNIADIADKSVLQDSLQKFQQLLQDGAMTQETILVRKDGIGVPIFLNAVELPNQRYMAFCTDITSLKWTKDALMVSSAKYQALLDSLPLGVTISDDDGNILESNREAERLLGLSKGEQVKRQIDGEEWRIIRPDGTPMHPSEFASVRALQEGRRVENVEMGIVKGDGDTTWISVNAAPIPLKGYGVAITYIDITERMGLEEMIRDSERLYRNLYQNAQVGLFETDLNTGTVVACSQEYSDLAGFASVQEAIGSDILHLYVNPEDREEVKRILRTEGRIKNHVLRLRKHSTGEEFWAEFSAHFDPARDVAEGVIVDVTERMKAEKELKLSEAKLRAVLDATPFPVALIDLEDDKIGFWSWSAHVLFGHTAPTSAEWYEIAYPDPDYRREAIDRWKSELTTARSSGQTVNTGEYQVTCHDGSVRICELHATYLADGLIVTFNDITERKRAQHLTEENLRFYESLLDTIPVPVFYKDKERRYKECNAAFESLLGLSRSQIIGRTVFEISPQELADKYSAADDQVFADKVSQVYDSQVRSVDGTLHDVIFRKAPYFDRKGEIDGLIGVIVDVTERRRAEHALQETNKKLNLLSSLTRHDIKNQLMALEGNLTLLAMMDLDPASEEQLRRSESAADRISAMIQFTKEYENVGVRAPIWKNARELITGAASDFTLNPINLVNDVPADLEVYADPLIAKVFHNLIDNAVRHGGGITTIHFFVEAHDDTRAIICEDDGTGIPPDIKGELFTHGSGKGHGFGLFLSSEILAITGMTIQEEAQPGKGARFRIRAPAGSWRSG